MFSQYLIISQSLGTPNLIFPSYSGTLDFIPTWPYNAPNQSSTQFSSVTK